MAKFDLLIKNYFGKLSMFMKAKLRKSPFLDLLKLILVLKFVLPAKNEFEHYRWHRLKAQVFK